MSIIVIVALILVYTFSGEQVNEGYLTEIRKFRQEKNKMFLDGEASPLTRQQKRNFDSLSYFPVNPAYRIMANFEEFAVKEMVKIPTSSENERQFVKFGVASFRLGNKQHKLTLLKQASRMGQLTGNGMLFLPFTDLTTGYETYSAGRYLDIEMPSGNKLEIDFNLAYNPYCAYNSTYECPLPPPENSLDIEMPAGELNYRGN